MQVPVAAVLNANTKRDTGKKAQFGNIAAAKVQRTIHCSDKDTSGCSRSGCSKHNAVGSPCCRPLQTSSGQHWGRVPC